MDSNRKQRQKLWLSVYKEELLRRTKLAQKSHKEYLNIYGPNLKPLRKECNGEHCWVPAPNLWIHDEKRPVVYIGDIARRSFREAHIYKSNGYGIVPQICWNCSKAVREKTYEILSPDQKKSLHKEIQHDKIKKNTHKIKRRQEKLDNLVTMDNLQKLEI